MTAVLSLFPIDIPLRFKLEQWRMTQMGVVEKMELKHVSRVDGNLRPISGSVEQNRTEQNRTVQYSTVQNSTVQSPWAAVRGGYVSSVGRGMTRC
jgi:hypothetical protein